jgi:cytochrome c-type biogenesis protein
LLVIVFGVLMLGIIKVPWLYGEARFDLEKSRSFDRGASLVMGMAFAAGWSPCVGPVLGSILALAGSSGSVGRGALLLLVYSAGLGVPFIAVALVFGRIRGLLRWLTRHSLVINRISGSIMIVIGVLIFFGRLEALAVWMQRLLPPIA